MTHRTSIRLGLEPLEDRRLLAGNVTAALVGNTLTLTGDDLANDITITQLAANQLRVVGNGGTQVEGAAQQDFTFPDGALKSLKLDLRGEVDKVSIGLSTSGENQVDLNALSVNSGAGADNISLFGVNVTGTGTTNFILGLPTELDNDIFKIFASDFGGNLTIKSGGGNDDVTLGETLFGFIGNTVAKRLLIDGDVGDDKIAIGGTVTTALTTRLGDGNDNFAFVDSSEVSTPLGATLIDGGDGKDTISIAFAVFRNKVKLRLGGDLNTVTIGGLGQDVAVDRGLSITGGDDFDDITIKELLTPTLTAKLFGGKDVFTVDNMAKGALGEPTAVKVDLGLGDDTATITDSSITKTSIKLGEGLNNLVMHGLNAGRLKITSGEQSDTVTLSGNTSVVVELLISLAGQSDTLTLGSITVIDRLFADGGTGTDTVIDNGGVVTPDDTTFVNFNP